MAEITPAQRNRDKAADGIKAAAAKVHAALLLRAKAGGRARPLNIHGQGMVAGFEVRLNASQAIRAAIGRDKDKVRLVRDYLRHTYNASCLMRQDGKVQALWWVRAEFDDRNLIALTAPRSDPRARAERRLTPHEAGEDREPLPVETRFTEPQPKEDPVAAATTTDRVTYTLSTPRPVGWDGWSDMERERYLRFAGARDEAKARQVERDRQAVLDDVIKHPMTTATQIANRTREGRGVGTVRAILNRFVEDGLIEVSSRKGKGAERRYVPAGYRRESRSGIRRFNQHAAIEKGVLETVRTAPAGRVSAAEVSTLTGYSPATAQRYLNELADAGLLTVTFTRPRWYSLTTVEEKQETAKVGDASDLVDVATMNERIAARGEAEADSPETVEATAPDSRSPLERLQALAKARQEADALKEQNAALKAEVEALRAERAATNAALDELGLA
jgi:transposase